MTPDYVFDILRALETGGPVDFRCHPVPEDVRQWCAANLVPVRRPAEIVSGPASEDRP